MTEKEILTIFQWTLEEYAVIKNENIKEKYGYFLAIIDTFSQIINFEKEATK